MNKGVMLSIHPEWIKMIFNGEKVLEFRNKIISTIRPETKIYFYENDKKNVSGKIVGEAVIVYVEEIDSYKRELYLRCYQYLGYFNQKYTIKFTAVQKYEVPLELSQFEYLNGRAIKRIPQNMINIRRKLEGTY